MTRAKQLVVGVSAFSAIGLLPDFENPAQWLGTHMAVLSST
jgi:hypothetical protein